MSGAPLRWLAALILCAAGPTTAAAQDVPADSSAYAIPCGELTELNSVYFTHGSAELSEDAHRLLEENTLLLASCSEVAVVVNGWASSGCGRRWSDAEPFPQLAERRAEAVRSFYLEANLGVGQVVVSHPMSEDFFGGGPKICDPTSDARGWRVDSLPFQGFAVSDAQASLLSSGQCSDTISFRPIPVARQRPDAYAAQLTEVGRKGLAEAAFVMRRCPDLQVSYCYPSGSNARRVRVQMFGLGVDFDRMLEEVPEAMCEQATRNAPDAVHLVVLDKTE